MNRPFSSQPGLRFYLFVFLLFTPFSLLPPAAVVYAQGGVKSIPVGPAECMRCHGMRTLARLDPQTGGLVSFFVDADALSRSNHGRLGCQGCHGAAFGVYPHFPEGAQERLSCLECHRNDDGARSGFPHATFQRIEREFERSIHFQAMPDAFDCFSCHDPHGFQRAASIGDIARVVRTGNEVCLGCHDASGPAGGLSKRAFASLDDTHRWLPKAKRHWQAVRCVECHTPHFGDRTHTILGGQQAERNCVACHSRDSVLKAKLYRHQAPEAREKGGWLSGVISNEAYVIGMSRHPLLDWIAFLGLGGTLFGLGGHGLLRWLAARRRQS